MDPNAVLCRILRALWDLSARGKVHTDSADYARADAVYAMRDLADWLESGGFAPEVNMPEGVGQNARGIFRVGKGT